MCGAYSIIYGDTNHCYLLLLVSVVAGGLLMLALPAKGGPLTLVLHSSSFSSYSYM